MIKRLGILVVILIIMALMACGGNSTVADHIESVKWVELEGPQGQTCYAYFFFMGYKGFSGLVCDDH